MTIINIFLVFYSQIFEDIGVIDRLMRVASSPNATASKYACQALKFMGKSVPHKLSQQVPLWTVADVLEWLKQVIIYSQLHFTLTI